MTPSSGCQQNHMRYWHQWPLISAASSSSFCRLNGHSLAIATCSTRSRGLPEGASVSGERDDTMAHSSTVTPAGRNHALSLGADLHPPAGMTTGECGQRLDTAKTQLRLQGGR